MLAIIRGRQSKGVRRSQASSRCEGDAEIMLKAEHYAKDLNVTLRASGILPCVPGHVVERGEAIIGSLAFQLPYQACQVT